jgi:hypothetical protein
VQPSRGLVAMIPIMLSVGLFDMSLRVVVDIFCTSKGHLLDEPLSTRVAPVGVDVPRVVSFFAVRQE